MQKLLPVYFLQAKAFKNRSMNTLLVVCLLLVLWIAFLYKISDSWNLLSCFVDQLLKKFRKFKKLRKTSFISLLKLTINRKICSLYEGQG